MDVFFQCIVESNISNSLILNGDVLEQKFTTKTNIYYFAQIRKTKRESSSKFHRNVDSPEDYSGG